MATTPTARASDSPASRAAAGVPEAPVLGLSRDAGLDRLDRTEWLLTNGLGGFAMGSASGLPSRRYHAILVAAMKPPGQREVMLSALYEALVLEAGTERERTVELSCFSFGGGVRHPRGERYLERFEKGADFCRWTWEVEGARIVKTLRLREGQNAAGVVYEITPGTGVARLLVRPLVAMRDFHHLMSKAAAEHAFIVESTQRRALVRRGARTLDLACDIGWFQEDWQWWYNFDLARELERGLDGHEDLFSPGIFSVQVRPGPTQSFALTVCAGERPAAWVHPEAAGHARLRALSEHALSRAPGVAEEDRLWLARLVAASDAYVVAGPSAATVIAGYPWFTDWGRDTMISLPGLFLCTGRFGEARRVLETFARFRRRGLIPNVFDDQTGAAEYNTLDASLWFIHAACQWLNAAGDRAAFEGEIRAACDEIVEAYRTGTEFNIRMDADGLIAAGDASTQLTWMDAKRDGTVFTPRHGKAVEINALWVHALRSLAEAVQATDRSRGAELRLLADRAADSFVRAFWNARSGCLYDVLLPGTKGKWTPDARIRPNQIFAASLERGPLSTKQRRAVVKVVRERLLTPVGLRTLDPADPGYKPRFEGSMYERDAAYHNGTVWPWLMGPYVEAVLRGGGFSRAARGEARAALLPLLAELDGLSLGQLPEVYDGESTPERPRRPGGCIAQAWSVAETLRAWLLVAG